MLKRHLAHEAVGLAHEAQCLRHNGTDSRPKRFRQANRWAASQFRSQTGKRSSCT